VLAVPRRVFEDLPPSRLRGLRSGHDERGHVGAHADLVLPDVRGRQVRGAQLPPPSC
jgi:hypothetical protein